MSKPLSFRQALLWCLPAFVVSRLILQVFDLQFDVSAMTRSWQFLDLALLDTHLWQSLWYQHSQPPLLNLFTGLCLWLPPALRATVLQCQFLLLSLLIMTAIFWLLQAHGIRRWLSYLLALGFIVSPEAILYENWFFYTWPVAAALILCACCLQLYHLHKQMRYLVVLCLLLTAILLTRSMFHLIYLIPAGLLLMLGVRPHHRRRMGLLVAVTLCISAAPYIKNQVVFGFFGGSSWSGMSLWRIVNLYDQALPLVLDAAAPQSATAQSTTPERAVASITPFAPLSDYPEALITVPKKFEQLDILSAAVKTTGATNYNHIGYLQLSEAYQAAAMTAIKADPTLYLKHILRAWAKYTEGSWQYFFLRENQLALMPWIESYTQFSRLLWLEQEVLGWQQDWVYDYPLLLCCGMLVTMLLVTAYSAGRGWHSWQSNHDRSALLVPGFMVLTIWYVALLGNLVEYGENNRFRVQTDPMLFTLLCLSIASILRQWSRLTRKPQEEASKQARITSPQRQ